MLKIKEGGGNIYHFQEEPIKKRTRGRFYDTFPAQKITTTVVKNIFVNGKGRKLPQKGRETKMNLESC